MEDSSKDMLRCQSPNGGEVTESKYLQFEKFKEKHEKPQFLDGIQPENSLDPSTTSLMESFSSYDDNNTIRCRSVTVPSSTSPRYQTISDNGKIVGGDMFETEKAANRRKSLCEYNATNNINSPGSGGMPKGLFAKSLRYSSGGAASTRKCLLTLDGYSYVIVASTPEKRSNREDTSSPATSPLERRTDANVGTVANVACNVVNENNKLKSTTGIRIAVGSEHASSSGNQTDKQNLLQQISGPVNGQISNQSSLTIVRRSSGRKGGSQSPDTYVNKYQQIQTTGSTINFDKTANSSVLNFVKAFEGRDIVPEVTKKEENLLIDPQYSTRMQTTPIVVSAPTTTNSNNFTTSITTSFTGSSNMSPTTVIESEHALSTGAADTERTSESVEISAGSVSCSPNDLATENLPAVDTPDACDKAALRLRSLLRLLQSGEISAEILQNNLHYAAQVLEAVFIDETKSPPENIISGHHSPSYCAKSANPHENVKCRHCSSTKYSGYDKDDNNQNNSNKFNKCCSIDDDRSIASNNQITSIEGRTKGVSMAPQTHSGPTGPPEDSLRKTQSEARTADETASVSTNTSRSKSPYAARRNGRSRNRKKTSKTPKPASYKYKRLADDDDELSEVQPDAVPPEVREWLASTFTRQLATTRKRNDEKPKFRSVAHAIRAGIFVDRIYRRVSSSALMQFPSEVVKVLKTLDDWSFDVFALTEAANGQPIKYLGYDLLNRYGIIHKFKITPITLETFLNRIEEGYCRFRNPYHNNLHAADVTQTVHHMLCQTGLMNWMTDLEIFATLLAALVHDYEHTGTTNNFHVMSGSDTALLYNDRAVLENHHASAAFRLLKDDDCNVLSNLSREEYRELRTLIIDMVLSTDMSFHFQQLKNMKNLLTLPEPTVDKSKALALVLHCCDISHPAKKWNLHHRWTMLLLEEFFRQGDLERELGLPFSPLCDRNNTLVAESQIGFIDFIVDPSMSVCADMLECVLAPIAPMCKNANASIDVDETSGSSGKSSNLTKPQCEAIAEDTETEPKNGDGNTKEENGAGENQQPESSAGVAKQKFQIRKPWMTCLTENKKIWKEQAIKDAEARAVAAAIDETKDNDETGSTLNESDNSQADN